MSPKLFFTLYMMVCLTLSECGKREVFYKRMHTLDDKQVSGWHNSQAVENFSACARACSDDTTCVSFSYGHGEKSCFRFSKHLLYSESVKSNYPGMVSFFKKGTCPTNYAHMESMRLKRYTYTATYSIATNICQGIRANLLSLQNREKFDDFFMLLSQKGYDLDENRWLSGSNDGHVVQWRWHDNSVLDSGSNLWCPGEPNNKGGNEHCTNIIRGSRCLNDAPCSVFCVISE